MNIFPIFNFLFFFNKLLYVNFNQILKNLHYYIYFLEFF